MGWCGPQNEAPRLLLEGGYNEMVRNHPLSTAGLYSHFPFSGGGGCLTHSFSSIQDFEQGERKSAKKPPAGGARAGWVEDAGLSHR